MSGHRPRHDARNGRNALYLGDNELAMLYAAAMPALNDASWVRGIAFRLAEDNKRPYALRDGGSTAALKLERAHNEMVERQRAAVA